MDELDILTGCQGWSLKSGPTKPEALELCLRYGPLFQLRIFFAKSEDGSSAAQGFLDLTSSGRLVQVMRLQYWRGFRVPADGFLKGCTLLVLPTQTGVLL